MKLRVFAELNKIFPPNALLGNSGAISKLNRFVVPSAEEEDVNIGHLLVNHESILK